MLLWLAALMMGEDGGAPLPPDYFAPRSPTVTLGPTLTPAVQVRATLAPTVTIIH